jgi:hypothetical protein
LWDYGVASFFLENPAMPLPVSLKEFVDEMETYSDDIQAYLNRRTGDFITVSSDDRAALDDDADDVPEWQRERLPAIRDVFSSDDWLELPSKFEIDEYDIMRRFCSTLSDEVLRGDLLDTIGGRGTFGRFKGMAARHGLLDDWYRFREQALKRFAVGWLEAQAIPYRE